MDAVRSGTLNVIDTAINYRYQKAERAVRAALPALLQEYQREELFLCTKAGYIPEDADSGETAGQLLERLVGQKLIESGDVVGQAHCMHPKFLEFSLNQSLTNLGVDTVDLMYLQNAAESQLPVTKKEEFLRRLGSAFEFLERARTDNKMGVYGLATWNCFRVPDSETDYHLSLEEVVNLA